MSKLLDLYAELNRRQSLDGARFIDEIFLAEIYKEARPKLTIVDLGAFEGEFSYYCYQFADKIYAIEPDPRPYAVMEEYINKYELGDTIKPFNLAIGQDNEDRMMHFSGYGGSTFSGEEGTPTKTLDIETFMKENQIDKIDVLKIDVESAEYEIFGSEAFARVADRIKFIIGEPHNGTPDLTPFGFKISTSNGVFIASK